MAAVQTLLRLLDAVSPSLATAMAWWLWLRPLRHRRPRREANLLAEATPQPLPTGAGHLAGWRWGEGPTVLLVHGWEGRGAQLGAFVSPLMAAGFSVVAFDAPGHGESPGRSANFPAFADAIAAASRTCGPLHGVVAHSMGAAATVWAMSGGLSIPRVVLVAPPDPALVLGRFQAFIGVSDQVRQGMERRLVERFGVRIEDIAGPRLAHTLPGRLMVVHDADDAFVPHTDGEAYAAASGAGLMTTRGLGHHRILRAPEVVHAATRFISDGVPLGERWQRQRLEAAAQ